MEISVLKETGYVDSTGITDDATAFVFPKCVTPSGDGNATAGEIIGTFKSGDVFRDTKAVYEKTTEPFEMKTPPADTGTISLGDVYFVGDDASAPLVPPLCLSEVTGLAGTQVAVQPEESAYDTHPGPNEFNQWSHRYAKLGTLDAQDRLSFSVGTTAGKIINHELIYDGAEWKYEIGEIVQKGRWSIGSESLSQYVIWNHTQNYTLTYKWNGTDVYTQANYIPGDWENYSPAGKEVTGTDGKTYKCGEYISGTSVHHYVIKKRVYSPEYVVISSETITLLNSSQLYVTEEIPILLRPTNLGAWMPKTLIRRGDDIYLRTDNAEAQKEKLSNVVTYEKLKYFNDADWGWTKLRPTNHYAPLDGKKYTFVKAPNPTYEVESKYPFNTLAINGLIAETVTVKFKHIDKNGDPIGTDIPLIAVTPDCYVDIQHRLPQAPTTLIVYAPRDITGRVELTFTNAVDTLIGGIHLGQSVGVGFTNMTFTNKFRDYSPYEKDQWGNILYTKGVKTNIYQGTVDVEIKEYDRINRMMAMLGGQTVILNGSDTVHNDDIDSTNFFASTQVVGRVRNFALKTKLDNKLMSQMATYSFEIEEDV